MNKFFLSFYFPYLVLGIIFVFVIYIYSVSQTSDYVTEFIFNRTLHLKLLPTGLDLLSEKEMIVEREGPVRCLVNKDEISDEAIVLVHGLFEVPNRFNIIFDYLHNKYENKDIYMPLLKYHGRHIREILKINCYEIANCLNNDLNYLVSLGYKKIYCVGHSLGGATLSYLSLKNLLDPRIKIILYNPSVYIKMHPIALMYCRLSRYLRKYIVVDMNYATTVGPLYILSEDLFGYSEQRESSFAMTRKFFNHYSFKYTRYVISKSPLLNVYDFSLEISSMGDKGCSLNNEFGYVVVENDMSADYNLLDEKLSMLFPVYKNILKTGKHSPDFSINQVDVHSIVTSLDKAINAFV